MIYIIITTSLIEKDWEIRKNQYKLAIFALIEYLRPYVFPENPQERKIQIIVVENQLATMMENPHSFLDDFGVDVIYTKSNNIATKNKGRKELEDIQICIEKINIINDDFIVKISGIVDVINNKSNNIAIKNKGRKEWEDIQICIEKFNITDDDFVVKLSGRYIVIHDETIVEQYGYGNFMRDVGDMFTLYNSKYPELSSGIGGIVQKYDDFYNNDPFFKPYFLSFLVDQFILNKNDNNIDCMIRYGSYNDVASTIPMKDCITGLIGMRCKYIKMIPRPEETECVEHLWANTSLSISNDRVKIFEKLGIYITPGDNAYFIV